MPDGQNFALKRTSDRLPAGVPAEGSDASYTGGIV